MTTDNFAPVPIKAGSAAPPDPSKGCTFVPMPPLPGPTPEPVPSKYAEFRVTADAVVFCFERGIPHVLLIKRKKAPYKGCWCFPGGHVDKDEDLAPAAYRELREETGLVVPDGELVQFGTYGKPGRDPRGQYVTVAFTTVLRHTNTEVFGIGPKPRIDTLPAVTGSDDASEAKWIPLHRIGASGPDGVQLGFDHGKILLDAISATDRDMGSYGTVRNELREGVGSRREAILTPADPRCGDGGDRQAPDDGTADLAGLASDTLQLETR